MLPEMTVEKRDGKSHGLVAPAEIGSEDHAEQLFDMQVLVRGVNDFRFSQETTSVLEKYAPFEMSNVEVTLGKFGFFDWSDCVDFVKDDLCVDFGRRVLQYANEEGLTTTFIHSNVVFFKRLMERMERTLQKCFDEKYHHKYQRPLAYMIDQHGENAQCMVNYTHPGHWAYPAGHGGKFFETVDLARDFWDLDERQDKEILTAAYVLAMARSGGGVHYPRDNVASGALAGLKEFSEYKA